MCLFDLHRDGEKVKESWVEGVRMGDASRNLRALWKGDS